MKYRVKSTDVYNLIEFVEADSPEDALDKALEKHPTFSPVGHTIEVTNQWGPVEDNDDSHKLTFYL